MTALRSISTPGLKAIGYTPTAGAYDSVSEELPAAVPVVPSSPIATLSARPGGEDRPASLPTLCDTDDAIQQLELVCAQDAAVAASQYAKLKGELEGSEARARHFLARLRRRIASPPQRAGAMIREEVPREAADGAA